MAHFPKPFFKKGRGVWYVEIDRKQHNLGPDKGEAFRRYHALMVEPKERRPKIVAPRSLAAIIDAFLDWVSRHRAADTYDWYRYRLQRFIDRYPTLRVAELRPYHVETWADDFSISITTRRNYLRSVKRCLKWAKKQGYIDSNPIADLEVPAAEAKEFAISQCEFENFLSFVRNPALVDLATGETICEERVTALVPTLSATKTVKGKIVNKSVSELRCEAKRKLTNKRAAEHVPRVSLYALRHSWATNALQRGVDPLSVAILMGHKDPSTLTKVYQHLSLNPQHMLEQAKRAAG